MEQQPKNNTTGSMIWSKKTKNESEQPEWAQKLTLAYEYILSDEWGKGDSLACLENQNGNKKTQ